MTDVELRDDQTMMRVVRQIERFIPVGARLPTWEAFYPSSADEEEARTHGCAIRVSVWDTDKTSATQARQLRPNAGPTTAYGLRVGTARAVANAANNPRFRVVADPLVPNPGPGGDGHCGVEGLDRAAGTPKNPHKAFLVDLAKTCVVLCDACTREAGEGHVCAPIPQSVDVTPVSPSSG